MENNIEKDERYIKIGFFFIVLGILFAIETFFKTNFLYKLWPVITIILGIGFLGIFLKREKREPVFLGISVYLIFFSLLALYCNFTTWHRLSVLWPSFILFLGLSFISMFSFKVKQKVYLFLGLILISLSLVFFLVFGLTVKVWWLIFLLIGASILTVGKLK